MSDHINYLQKLVDALGQQKSSHNVHVVGVMNKAQELANQQVTPQSETAQPAPSQ